MDRWGILAPQPLSTRPRPRPYLTRAAGPIAAHHSPAAPARATEDAGRDGAGGSDRADSGPFGARRRDTGAGTTELAPSVTVAELRASELEKRTRHILDHTTNLDN